MPGKRVLIIEDEADMAELVALRLRREHYEVDVAHEGETGLAKVRASPPDLVVLDIMLPGMSGTEVLKEMRSDPRTAHVSTVMLTARTEDSDVVVGLQLGADDYVTKPFSMSVLLARIEAVLRRTEAPAGAQTGVLSAGPIQVNQQTHRAAVDGKAVSLTLTEFNLLTALMRARGRVLSRNQLIDRAIGRDVIVTDRTIDVHLAALRRKLGKARDLIQTVRGVGYRLTAEQDETP